MAPLMPEDDLEIFDAHRLILGDDEFIGRIRETIISGYAADSALFRVVDEMSASMMAVADGYLRERATDFRDVGHRILRHLRQDDKQFRLYQAHRHHRRRVDALAVTLVTHENLVGYRTSIGRSDFTRCDTRSRIRDSDRRRRRAPDGSRRRGR